jgi:ABC-type glycerol-3-phosphate transport system substrate-binding protein
MIKTRIALAAFAVPLAVLAAGCGGGGGGGGGATGSEDVSGNITVTGAWTGDEQNASQAVLDGFKEKSPNVSVKYNATGDNTPTVLSTAVQGGPPPALSSVSQPGLMKHFQQKCALQPLYFAKSDIDDNFPEDFVKLTTIDGKIYGLIFKGANKSTVWYNVKSFNDAGVETPKTWDDLVQDADTIKASGTTPFSVGGADGWTLTDLFENIYLRQAGGDMYDKLSNHEIKWTDDSVKQALQTMGQYLKGDLIAGGTSGALQTDFPTSVSNVFSDSPKASMVAEGDFVPGVVASSNPLQPVDGYNVFPFPSVDGSSESVVGGGDTIMMFKDSPAAEALITYLTTAEAAEIWAKRGGFSSPNTNLDTSVYPDEITKTTASALATTKVFRFDMSDLQPAAFGGTVGQGEFKIFQDFLKNPSDVDGVASALEASAAKAYASK